MREKNNILNNNKTPKILVLSALPITKSATTRAFYTYLAKFPRENIAQIYTNTSSPTDFDICENYYQITDSAVLNSFFHKNAEIGEVINYKSEKHIEISNSTKKLVSLGKKNYPSVDLLRNRLWKKKKYLNPKFKEWLLQFNPDVVFFHNSNALFIEKMCFDIIELIKKPLILEISDDYYFGKKFSFSPFYYLRRKKYKKFFTNLMRKSSAQIYISNKMEQKYNNHFHKNGHTIYISSEIEKKESPSITVKRIGYFGNIGLGRKKTLELLSSKLKQIDDSIVIDVFCPNFGNSDIKKMDKKGICYKEFIKYDELDKKMKEYDLLLFVESFKKKTLSETAYSLSTKIGDYLSSGIPILAYGPKSSGSIEFLLKNECAFVCVNNKDIDNVCKSVLCNSAKKEMILKNALETSKKYFDIEKNSNTCFNIISNVAKK